MIGSIINNRCSIVIQNDIKYKGFYNGFSLFINDKNGTTKNPMNGISINDRFLIIINDHNGIEKTIEIPVKLWSKINIKHVYANPNYRKTYYSHDIICDDIRIRLYFEDLESDGFITYIIKKENDDVFIDASSIFIDK